MKSVILAALVGAVILVPQDATKVGAGVTLKEATPIESLVDRPDEFVGKTVRVDGVATAVCEHMGCWMAVATNADEGGKTVRLKVDDGVIVFPVTAKGKKVSAEGVFELIAGAEAKEAAGDPSTSSGSSRAASRDEHAKRDAKAPAHYQIKATGAVIR